VNPLSTVRTALRKWAIHSWGILGGAMVDYNLKRMKTMELIARPKPNYLDFHLQSKNGVSQTGLE
jgi:hypothetical protein